jgi:hypothetical protein
MSASNCVGLAIGLNAYPRAPLSGCVNDVVHGLNHTYFKGAGFNPDNTRMITDARGTTVGIKKRLEWLAKSIRPGMNVLLWYSGHGAYFPSRDPETAEVDGMDEVLCPIDFNWTENTLISDSWIYETFKDKLNDCRMLFVADCCHSGTISRGMRSVPTNVADEQVQAAAQRQCRSFPNMPACLHWRAQSTRAVKKRTQDRELNATVISGCMDQQTSADVFISEVNRWHGALSYHFLKALDTTLTGASITDIFDRTYRAVKQAGFEQNPQLGGAASVDTAKPLFNFASLLPVPAQTADTVLSVLRTPQGSRHLNRVKRYLLEWSAESSDSLSEAQHFYALRVKLGAYHYKNNRDPKVEKAVEMYFSQDENLRNLLKSV